MINRTILVAALGVSTMSFAFTNSINLTNQLNNNLHQLHNSPTTNNNSLLYGGQDLKPRVASIEHVANPIESIELVG